METGIVGLPLSGKTTIFNALTGRSASTGQYSGGKSGTNLAEVEVPDHRVLRLGEVFHTRKIVQAAILFKDIQVEFHADSGIAPGTLSEVGASDALAVIVRAFLDPAVPHPLESVDPRRDLVRVLDSLVFRDYEIVEKRLERLQKEGNRGGREAQLLDRISQRLSGGELIGREFLSPEESKMVSGFRLLTEKPLIVVANIGEQAPDLDGLREETGRRRLDLFPIRGDVEMDIAQLDPAEQKEFLQDIGLDEPAKDRFIKEIYRNLNLISFLTAGDKETRAWSIPRGTTAVKAAGKIHSDLEKGFIRAEVVHWEDLVSCGEYAPARKAGKLRLEGKEYAVRDGDVLVIRFNV